MPMERQKNREKVSHPAAGEILGRVITCLLYTSPVLEHRGALLNTGDTTLCFQNQIIPLTKNEYRILLALMENKGKIVSRERLMERLWDCLLYTSRCV